MISLGPTLDGVDESRGRGAKIERGEGAAIGGFEKRLILGGGEEVLMSAVGVLVEQFDTRYESSAGMAVGDGFGAN